MPRRKCLKWKARNRRLEMGVKNERAKWKLEGKLPPFSTFFFFSMVYFLLLKKKKMLRENVWNKRAKAGRQKQKPKVKRQSGSLKVSSLLSLGFFLVVFLCVLFSLCLRKWKQRHVVNVPSFSFMVLFQWRKRWQLVTITFFSVGVQAKKVTTTCCCCLLFCVREEEDNNNVSLSYFMVLLEQKKATTTSCRHLLFCV